MNLREIIRIKRAASCCTGQKEDICPSIKKSMTKINFYCRSGEKAVIQLSVFDHMLSGQEEFEAEE